MPSITLIRHGPITLDLEQPVEARRFVELMDEADASGIRPDVPPPPELLAAVREAGCFLSSDLRRSQESAALVAQGRPVQADPLYREIPLRCHLPGSFRLPALSFFRFLRLLRRWGLAFDGESVGQTRRRAGEAAEALESLATAHPSVVLVAHAMINRQIAGALRRRGWRGPERPSSKNWGATVYRRG
ncbi:MAG: histidine phosphatase family protein [Acidobacteriota bacterium]|nr:histidine phosphatase family protein [Acidobacteriota bacterium]